jgi:hypothetical protein
MSDNAALFIQRYDGAGNKIGTEVSVPLVIQSGNANVSALAFQNSSIAVLSNGDVVVAYTVNRDASPSPTGPSITNRSIYIQRFDANGVQVLPETAVVSREEQIFNRSPFFSNIKAVALADGGFVVSWEFGGLGLVNTVLTGVEELFHRRYDRQSQPVGGIVSVGRFVDLTYSLTADASGGYTLSMTHDDESTVAAGTIANRVVSVVHDNAADTATQIVAPRPGTALLLPLRSDRFVLFTSDASGVSRQFLDSAGNPVGAATGVSSMPVAATELADGSFVVFSPAGGGGFTAQRFDANGGALGDAVSVDAIVSQPGVASLTGGALALAWTATLAGDADVFTQRVLVQN